MTRLEYQHWGDHWVQKVEGRYAPLVSDHMLVVGDLHCGSHLVHNMELR